MIVNAPQFPADQATSYDICIIGAGAAGISLALELDATDRRICLLEAGGDGYERATQRLYAGEVVGDHYPSLRDMWLGALGGSTGVWAGWCRPLEETDFEPKPWLDTDGWPFRRDELLPYYRRAHKICGLGDFEYDAGYWGTRLGQRMLLTGDENICNRIFHVNALHFGVRYRQRLEDSDNIHLVLHAPVTRCHRNNHTNRIDRVEVRMPGGRQCAIQARYFVLAAGGIENARLLLLSADSPDGAPGNEYGLVGRYFTDHPFIDPGSLLMQGGPDTLNYYFPHTVNDTGGNTTVRGAFSLAPGILERERLQNAAIFFHPRYESHPAFATPEVKAFLEAWAKLRRKAVPGAAWPYIARAIRAPRAVMVAAIRKLTVGNGPARRWRLRAMFESESRYDNRVTLDTRRDELDRPLPRIKWQLGERDLASMHRGIQLFDASIRRAGIGHVELAFPDEPSAWRQAAECGKHHMGTTRMHVDPGQGVVDGNTRVHGTSNLFVTGSSVFPSGGYANPTLTIVALAIRLGDYIKRLR
jgi:choline dehydrogenase-like flavoprotein